MARPIKSGVDYFPHDTDSASRKTLFTANRKILIFAGGAPLAFLTVKYASVYGQILGIKREKYAFYESFSLLK